MHKIILKHKPSQYKSWDILKKLVIYFMKFLCQNQEENKITFHNIYTGKVHEVKKVFFLCKKANSKYFIRIEKSNKWHPHYIIHPQKYTLCFVLIANKQ